MPFCWPTSQVGALHPLSENASARARGVEFLRFAAAARKGISYREAKRLFGVSGHQAETRKSLYEEFGLLYVPRRSDELILTPVGEQLLDLLGESPPVNPSADLRQKVDGIIAWALSNAQINRPQSHGSPAPTADDRQKCDLKPYATFWQAIRDLEYIHLTEFFGAVWSLQQVAGYDGALDRIKVSRAKNKPLFDDAKYLGRSPLMNSRIYWVSHLSIAGSVLDLLDDGTLRFNRGREDLLNAILDFQAGCGGEKSQALRAVPYADVHGYYSVAGRASPQFIAAGSVRAVDINTNNVPILSGYDIRPHGSQRYVVDGGPELCALPLKAQCFHKSVRERLLRLDEKYATSDGVRVVLGRGLVVTHPDAFLGEGGENAGS